MSAELNNDPNGYLIGIERYQEEITRLTEAMGNEPNEYRRLVMREQVEVCELLIHQNKRRHEVLVEGKPLELSTGIIKQMPSQATLEKFIDHLSGGDSLTVFDVEKGLFVDYGRR